MCINRCKLCIFSSIKITTIFFFKKLIVSSLY
jgi:hypothetical protein